METEKSISQPMKAMIVLTAQGQYIVFESVLEVENGRNVYFMREPMIINVMPQSQGPPQIQMIPLIQFGDPEVTLIEKFSEENVLTIYPANPQISKSYEDIVMRIRAARSGIDLSTTMPKGSVSGDGSKAGPVIQFPPKGGGGRKQ